MTGVLGKVNPTGYLLTPTRPSEMPTKFKQLPSLLTLSEERITYSAETGQLKRFGKPIHPNKNSQISIKGQLYTAHRIIWLLTTGSEPKEAIDHRNGVDNSNQIENLREATHQQNLWNRMPGSKNNLPKGVRKHGSKPNTWVAVLSIDGKKINLGNYKSIELAWVIALTTEINTRGEYSYYQRPDLEVSH